MDIVQILKDIGMDSNPGLLPAFRGRHSETVQLLLEYGGMEHEEAIKALSTKEKRDMMLIYPISCVNFFV